MSSVRPAVPLAPHARGPVPAPTGREAAAWDRRAIEVNGVPQAVLMESAGRAVAEVVARLYPGGPVVGVVGAGNNGGDTLVALRTLAAWGREVLAVLAADREVEDPLLHGWPVRTLVDRDLGEDGWARALSAAGVVLDGVLGTGMRGPARERQAEAIRAINASGRPVLALDVPSGIDADTGGVPGEAVRADLTVAFGGPKLGSLLHPARALTGRLVAVEIGFPPPEPGEVGALVVTPDWARARIPARASDTHKNAVGRVLVVGGGLGMAGAAVLAARGALRAGAGLVRLATTAGNREVVQAALPEALWVDLGDRRGLASAVDACDAMVIGPGLGKDPEARAGLEAALAARPVPTLLDADALNLAAEGTFDLSAIASGRPLLVTPHPGEMGRLLGADPEGAADRAGRARAAAARFGCAVLYKGAPSVVAAPDGPLLLDSQGSSDLAAAGMGDTLAGVCGTLLAQGLEPAEAGAVGLYLSGRAACLAHRGAGLTPSDVVAWLPDALGEAQPSADTLGVPCAFFDADPAH